jgi:hypothetical protein
MDAGGGIAIDGVEMTFNLTIGSFTNNWVMDGDPDASGGALFIAAAFNIILYSVEMRHGLALYGGAISIAATQSVDTRMTVSYCLFHDNFAYGIPVGFFFAFCLSAIIHVFLGIER